MLWHSDLVSRLYLPIAFLSSVGIRLGLKGDMFRGARFERVDSLYGMSWFLLHVYLSVYWPLHEHLCQAVLTYYLLQPRLPWE